MLQKDNKQLENTLLNLVLLMLFLSSIALICMKYNLLSSVKTAFSSVNLSFDGKIIREYILPNKIKIRFSKDSATILEDYQDDYMEDFSSCLREAFLDDIEIKKINRFEYESSLNLKNITYEYGNIPSRIIEKSVGLRNTSLANLGAIKNITFILQEKKGKQIYIETSDSIYMLEKDLINKFKNVDQVENSNYVSYYPIFNNENKSSNILIPLNPIVNVKNIDVSSSIKRTTIDNISRALFGEKIDFTSFVRRSDGSYFYSYKNGQEIMSIGKDSLLKYKNNELTIRKSISQYDAVLLLINFLDNLQATGNISIYSIEEKQVTGSQIIKINIKKNIDGTPLVLFPEGSMENITITNGIISSCNIYLYDVKSDTTNKKIAPLNPIDALSKNSKTISEDFNIEKLPKITNLIDNIDMIYTLDKRNSLHYSWLYKIKDRIYVIDSSTGEMLHGYN